MNDYQLESQCRQFDLSGEQLLALRTLVEASQHSNKQRLLDALDIRIASVRQLTHVNRAGPISARSGLQSTSDGPPGLRYRYKSQLWDAITAETTDEELQQLAANWVDLGKRDVPSSSSIVNWGLIAVCGAVGSVVWHLGAWPVLYPLFLFAATLLGNEVVTSMRALRGGVTSRQARQQEQYKHFKLRRDKRRSEAATALQRAAQSNEESRVPQRSGWWGKYANYLRSGDWKRTRGRVLRRDSGRCVYCGSRATQVHHVKYTSAHRRGDFGRQLLKNMVSICAPCHEKQHGRRLS